MDKAIIFTVILIIFAGFLFWGFQSLRPVVIPEGIILFYGQGCPHCKIVDDFITENKIKEKVKFLNLEVWYNKDNQKVLEKVAQRCGIKGDSVGVPFLYDGSGKCFVGDIDVVNFFKEKL